VRRDSATSVSLLAASPDGQQYFRGNVPQEAVAASDAASRQTTFEVPPGRLQLRMGVNGTNGPIDSDDREVIVPDLTAVAAGFATPRVYVARTARDFVMIRKDPDAVPSASREFRRTERMVVRVDTYSPGAAPMTVTARMLNRQGGKLVDVPVTSTPGQPHLIDLPLAAFAPGEYLLELSGTTEGQPPVTELIAFRVEG
jgi:hypothetical protein